jgi:phosphate-selective porin OprO and OprP
MFRLAFSFDDGNLSGEAFGDPATDAGTNDFASDDVDVAFGGRLDVKIMGDWNQMKDFTSWSGEETGLFAGVALRYIRNEEGDSTGGPAPIDSTFNDQSFQWTVDASFESGGFNAFIAGTGLHFDAEDGTGEAGLDAYGLVVQAGYNINDKWEPFGRYEYIDMDNFFGEGGDNHLNILTFGVNYYIARHSAKATLDLVYLMDEFTADEFGGDTGGGTLIGLVPSGEDDQVVVRAQMQLLF